MDDQKNELGLIEQLDNITEQLEIYEKLLAGRAEQTPERSIEELRRQREERAQSTYREILRRLDKLEVQIEQLEGMETRLDLLEDMEEELHYIRHFLDTRLDYDFNAMYNNMLEQMNVEAIKIYRNIQAVIVEEEAKQNHVLFGVDGKSDKLKLRMNHVMIFSIISFVVSILVMVVQILPFFGIDFL